MTSPKDVQAACTSLSTTASDYSSHKEQVLSALPKAEQIEELNLSLISAFKNVISYQEVAVISFGDMNADELAQAFFNYPRVIKPILSCVNIAGRAIKRDLGVDIDTYGKKITKHQADLLSGYIKPFLPEIITLPALLELDRYFWTDKEMRAQKGNWEKRITKVINEITEVEFKKRKFVSNNNEYELDVAYPAKGDLIEVGIDIKRIEAIQDIHKRVDEIINKASKFKQTYKDSLFIAIIYFPFPTQHINLQSRLQHADINHIFFAGETDSSILSCVEMLAGLLPISSKKKP